MPPAYGRDVLDDWEREKRARRAPPPEVPARPGLVVEHRASAFVGAVVRMSGDAVELRRPDGTSRLFALAPGAFCVERRVVTLVKAPPPLPATSRPAVTASGSVAAPGAPAKVAQASRILVEGIHDAELVEKIWGDDLRGEGVVVEPLDGIDHLDAFVQAFRPGPGRKLGVLVDHLVPGSKEARIAEAVGGRSPHVLITGTPYVDVWQAIRPHVVGLERWPQIPRGTDWKTGIGAVFGEPDSGRLWKRLLGSVRTYADLEPALVGAVERLIDFVLDL